MPTERRKFIFDMETGDPDDFLTLALLAGHPRIDLIGATVTPGTPHQVGVVRHGLEMFDLDIPVGAFDIGHLKARGTPDERYVSCVSPWHYRTFGDIPPSEDAEPGWHVLDRLLGPDTTLVTGAALKNLGALLRQIGIRIYDHPPNLGRLFVQGGFAGDNVVPWALRLPKFEGKITCPTYNLNGDPKSAEAVFASPSYWEDMRLVSKNVCHGVVYDGEMHERLLAMGEHHPGLKVVVEAMAKYLARKPSGKKFHDPLAAMCALEPSIGTWARGRPYRKKGQWGFEPDEDSPIRIIIDHDHDLFLRTMAG